MGYGKTKDKLKNVFTRMTLQTFQFNVFIVCWLHSSKDINLFIAAKQIWLYHLKQHDLNLIFYSEFQYDSRIGQCFK